MNAKSILYKILISIAAILFSVSTTAIGYGFIGASSMTFLAKFFYGFIFIMSPLCVLQLIIIIFRKS